jgi:hypothetical protein
MKVSKFGAQLDFMRGTGKNQILAINKTTGRKPASYSRGDVMTGEETGSVTKAGGIGWALSSAGSCVAVARIVGQSAPLSYRVYFSRHMSRTASTFTIGIRGATPPPAG